MRLLIQRVSKASVTVEEQTISKIGKGLLILLGIGHDDGEDQAAFLAEKTANLRIFEAEQGRTNLSVLDVKGEAIVVSQFTLYADTGKGRRPSFTEAAPPEVARPLIERFAGLLTTQGVPTPEQKARRALPGYGERHVFKDLCGTGETRLRRLRRGRAHRIGRGLDRALRSGSPRGS